MKPSQEELLGARIVGYLGKSPEVPTDVATRLAFARNKAVQLAARPTPHSLQVQVIALSPWRAFSRRVLLTSLALLALVAFNPSRPWQSLSAEQRYELEYHQTAEQAQPDEY